MIDLTGEKFERLVILERVTNNKHGKPMWLCLCDCGVEKIVCGGHLKSGNTKSCGCLNTEKLIKRLTKHGHSKKGKSSGTYISWINMIQRCINPNNKAYHNYGGRGITVCESWVEFVNFLIDMGEMLEGYQMDRIDNDGNYCKANCRWATRKEQGRNKRNNRLETYGGKTQLLIELAEEYQIPYKTLFARINKLGWSLEKALTTPVQKRKNNAYTNGLST